MPELGYWKIRGLAQPIRLLLKYVGEDFEDKHYECGPAPDYNRDGWNKAKATIGLDFPNLPYYIDGDIKVTQSNAILRYIARKHNLCGSSETEKVRVDMMENIAMDFRNAAVRLFYNPAFDKLKEGYLKDLKVKLQQFEKFIADRKFFASDEVTLVDFPMYELIDQHRVLEPKCLDCCPKLKAFMDRFEALPSISKYMASDAFIKEPINNTMAKFGRPVKEEDEKKE